MRWHQDSKLTISVSKKKWVEGESQGVELGWEGSTDGDTDLDKAYAEKYAELDALAEKFLDSNPTIEDVASELGAEVAGGRAIETDVPAILSPPAGPIPTRGEEKPPLPGEDISTQTGPAIVEEVRTPVAENGDELVSFLVQRIVIIEGDSGQNYAKIFGGNVMKFGASAWPEKMEDIFGDIQDLDHKQELPPPYPIKAFCTVSEKGYANRVQYFEKA
jgi:hypothetical protein